MRVFAGILSLALLAGCDGTLPGFGELRDGFKIKSPVQEAKSKPKPRPSTKKADAQIVVTRNKVKLLGPEGFCVDPKSTRTSASQAFVVFGNCAAISGNSSQPQPFLEAIATATVTGSGLDGGAAIGGQPDVLRGYLQTLEGRQTLSRTNAAETVSVIDSFDDRGAVYVHVRDTSPGHVKGAQDTYWRAYFDVDEAAVAMSVIGFKRAPLSGPEGLDTLQGFVGRIRRAGALAREEAVAVKTN